MSAFQFALLARFDADRDFTRAHDQLGKLIDDLIAEREGLRSVAGYIEGTRQMRTERN